MQVLATRWRFSSLFRHQMELFSRKFAKNRQKSRKMQIFATRWRFFFFEKMQVFAALVHFFATRWHFLKKNRKKSRKMQVFATRWRFSSLFRHQMAFFKEKSRIMQVFATRGRFFFFLNARFCHQRAFFF